MQDPSCIIDPPPPSSLPFLALASLELRERITSTVEKMVRISSCVNTGCADNNASRRGMRNSYVLKKRKEEENKSVASVASACHSVSAFP
jgi:hypothetical protein